MKLTPLDIHHKEFGHSLRGYNEEQVDGFLDEVADEFERLFKENIDLNEKLDAANERVRTYQQIEATINATLLQAQRSSEEIIAKASTEADSVLRDAELKAKEIIHNALQRKQAIANELIRIKQAEEDFRARYRALLEDKLHSVNEITLPDDVSLLLGETDDGVVGDVSVRQFMPPPAAPAPAPTPASPPTPAPSEPAAATEPAPSGVDQPTMAMPAVEPPESGFVSSVALGELGSPAIEPEVELAEPGEFSLPGFDSFGEREDDHDIEEID
jgi:cell division initiation protein